MKRKQKRKWWKRKVNKNKHGSNFNENKAGDVVSGKGADADLD